MGFSLAFAVEGQRTDGSWGMLFDSDLLDTHWWESHWDGDTAAQANAEGLVDALVGKRTTLLGALTGVPMANLLEREGLGDEHGIVRKGRTPSYSWPDDVSQVARDAGWEQRTGWWLWADTATWATQLAQVRAPSLWQRLRKAFAKELPHTWCTDEALAPVQRQDALAFCHALDAFLRDFLGHTGRGPWFGSWMAQTLGEDCAEDDDPLGNSAHERLRNTADFPSPHHWHTGNVRILFRVI